MVRWWLTPGQDLSIHSAWWSDTFLALGWCETQAGTSLGGKDHLPFGLVTHGLAANDLDIVSLRRIK